MVKKREQKKEVNEDKISRTWVDSYTAVSKMWEDSYEKLYKPWIESTSEMFEKNAILTKEATPNKYREFYDEWIKIYQNSFGKFYPIPTPESNKEALEKFISIAEESNKLFRSLIEELEDNSRKTKEILSGKPDPAKYKECYDMWNKSYEKIFDELIELPAKESSKEIFNYMGIPDIYSGNLLKMSKPWKKSYIKLCKPLNESMLKISGKMSEISRGDAGPEPYKEFFTLWMDTYKDINGKYLQSNELSSEMFENFVESTNIYLSLYKSWITALEEMSEKASQMSKQTSDPEANKEFYNIWLSMYEKAFESFFEDMPTVGGPMNEVMEPVKVIGKMYTETFAKMSKMWGGSDIRSASAYPGKNKKK